MAYKHNKSMNKFFATGLSGGTIYSGSTDLYQIFAPVGGGDITRVQDGTNIVTGGTINFPTINLVDSPSIDSLTASGTGEFATITSGGTNLYDIFVQDSEIPVLTASNGITKTANNFTLGGALTGDTTIDGSAGNHDFTVFGQVIKLSGTNPYNGLTLDNTAQPFASLYAAQDYGFFANATVVSVNRGTSSNILLDGSSINLTQGSVNLDVDGSDITMNTASGNQLLVGSGGLVYTDANNQGGAKYGGDYEANFGPRSLVTLQFVTGLTDSIETDLSDKYDKTGGTINGSVFITGNLDVFGTATTLNTEIVRAEDNNIELNYNGSHNSAYGGGITVLSGVSNTINSTLTIDGDGKWSANTEFIAGDGFDVEGGILASGGTDLYSIFATENTDDITRVQGGANILTGGTDNEPIVSLVDSPSVANFTASGTSDFATADFDTITSGGTDLYSIFATENTDDVTRVQGGANILTGGTENEPIINLVDSPSVEDFNASGNTILGSLTATSIVSQAIRMTTGANDGYVISSNANGDFTWVDPGSFSPDATFVQPGTNTTTGGTSLFPEVNVVDSPSFDNLNVSGTGEFTTITSGGTPLEEIFQGIAFENALWLSGSGDNSIIMPGTSGGGSPNTATGKHALAIGTTSNASGENSFAAGQNGNAYGKNSAAFGGYSSSAGYNSVAAGGYYATADNGSFATGQYATATGNYSSAQGTRTYAYATNSHAGGRDTKVDATANYSFVHSKESYVYATHAAILGGDTNNLSSAAVRSVILGGQNIIGTAPDTVYGVNFAASGTITSGGTDLYSIFLTEAPASDVTRVQGGTNILTGGTDNFPTVNLVSSPSIDSLNVSGTGEFALITSGGTPLEDIFVSDASNKYDKSGGTVSGNVTITGNLEVLGDEIIFNTQIVQSEDKNITLNYNPTAQTHASAVGGGITVQDGVSDGTDTTLTIDGDGKWSASTEFFAADGLDVINGSVMASGGTDLYSIFSTENTDDITRVQPGNNISTGGTENNPIINLIDNPVVNNFTAATISSGTTDLYEIFEPIGATLENIVEATTATFALSNDNSAMIMSNYTFGSQTINLPSNPPSGSRYTVKDITGNAVANNITVTTAGGSVNIDGNTTDVIDEDYASATYVFFGGAYYIK